MSPTSAEDWISVARQRTADADAIYSNKETQNSVGCVYMAGYAIECSLKALLQKKGIKVPTQGREGHNLRGLWQKANLSFSDIPDPQGTQTFFLNPSKWSTDLRYESSLPNSDGLEIADLIKGAKLLSSFIQTQIRRSHNSRNKK